MPFSLFRREEMITFRGTPCITSEEDNIGKYLHTEYIFIFSCLSRLMSGVRWSGVYIRVRGCPYFQYQTVVLCGIV